MERRFLAPVLLLATLVLPAPALAGWGIVDLEIGAKGGAGGSVWTEPTHRPDYLDGQDWAFSRQRGGWNAGAGLYAQLRVLKFLGLEVDLLVQQTQLGETPLDGSTWRLTAKSLNLHLPILIQGILPLPGVRLGLGIGPEFVFPLRTQALQSNTPAEFAGVPFKVDSKIATLLTIGLNITPTIGPVSIPIDLRASYNASQPKDFEGRVTVNSDDNGDRKVLPNGFTVHHQDTWDFRLLLGVGYSF